MTQERLEPKLYADIPLKKIGSSNASIKRISVTQQSTKKKPLIVANLKWAQTD